MVEIVYDTFTLTPEEEAQCEGNIHKRKALLWKKAMENAETWRGKPRITPGFQEEAARLWIEAVQASTEKKKSKSVQPQAGQVETTVQKPSA